MNHPLRTFVNRRAFRRAKDEASEAGAMVCATVRADGRPVYFTMSPKASEEEIAKRAFALREGRPFSAVEQTLKGLADNYRRKQGER